VANRPRLVAERSAREMKSGPNLACHAGAVSFGAVVIGRRDLKLTLFRIEYEAT
jgi:hypothetical protein